MHASNRWILAPVVGCVQQAAQQVSIPFRSTLNSVNLNPEKISSPELRECGKCGRAERFASGGVAHPTVSIAKCEHGRSCRAIRRSASVPGRDSCRIEVNTVNEPFQTSAPEGSLPTIETALPTATIARSLPWTDQLGRGLAIVAVSIAKCEHGRSCRAIRRSASVPGRDSCRIEVNTVNEPFQTSAPEGSLPTIETALPTATIARSLPWTDQLGRGLPSAHR